MTRRPGSALMSLEARSPASEDSAPEHGLEEIQSCLVVYEQLTLRTTGHFADEILIGKSSGS